jgi:hypothetical protein
MVSARSRTLKFPLGNFYRINFEASNIKPISQSNGCPTSGRVVVQRKGIFTVLIAVGGVSGLRHRALGYLPEDGPGPA